MTGLLFAGVGPVAVALSIWLSWNPILAVLTRGMQAGDHRIAQQAWAMGGMVFFGYGVMIPLLIVTLAIASQTWPLFHVGRRWLFTVLFLTFAGVSWVAGALVLMGTVLNE